MGESIEAVAEQALTKLLFALEDLECHGLQTRELSDVREKLVSAIENLSQVAPRFDFDREVTSVRLSSVKRRQVRKYVI
jgi:hypothetical protein